MHSDKNKFRVTTFQENLQMSGNLTTIREVSGNKSCQKNCFIANLTFEATSVFSSMVMHNR